MKKYLFLCLPLLLLSMEMQSKTFEPHKMTIKAYASNVRAKPVDHSGEYPYDALQETQVEEGEVVMVHEEAGEWAKIEALEQTMVSKENKWVQYPGWVKKADLSPIAKSDSSSIKKSNLPDYELRNLIIENAMKHLGNPYLWGGKSMHRADITDTPTGVDCSGLVIWSFRQVGWLVPRDSHDQFLAAKTILSSEELQPGDLIFWRKKGKTRVTHVALYLGGEYMLEAVQAQGKVRVVSFKDKIGCSKKLLKNEYTSPEATIHLGTFF